jgi:SAM-dependent methyltransferase
MPDPEHLGGWHGLDGNSYCPWLWAWLIEEYETCSMLDVGCGAANAAQWFLDHGVDAWGIDGSEEARKVSRIPQERFILHDFAQPISPVEACDQQLLRNYDLIWCCEFLEHVDECWVSKIADVLRLGSVIALTHGLPGQGGHHHVHLKEPSYWVDKMNEIGFQLDVEATKFSKTLVPEEVRTNSYWDWSGMIFVRRGR